MESPKYPKSTFRGKINEKNDYTKDGVYKVTCSGLMYMHGVEKQITVPGTITVKGGDLHLVAGFKAKLDDYKIARPKVVMEKIADEIVKAQESGSDPIIAIQNIPNLTNDEKQEAISQLKGMQKSNIGIDTNKKIILGVVAVIGLVVLYKYYQSQKQQ
jgi:glycosylphosphatidylinositol transamidase (GPIT) subunit GPI8